MRTVFFIGLLFFVVEAIAQKGKITGYVRDAKTQEALIGVTVKLEDTTLGGVTDLDGYYRIPNIPVGTYNVVASFVGYKKEKKFDIQVFSGNTINLNFNLKEAGDSLSEVVIQANPFENTVESPNSVNTLSQVEIAKYPGGNNDIAKVVQSLPGVSGSVGFRNDIIIRGGAPNENVYYLDAIEIPNINHFATQGAAGGPVGIINVSFIENVKLYTSAFPAQYDNPLSGAIRFIQRDGNPEEFQGNLRVSSSEAALTVEGPLSKKNKKTTFIASARRSYLDFLFEYVIDLPFIPEYWDWQYKINHKIDDKNTLSLIGIGSLDNFTFNPPDPPEEREGEEFIDYLNKLAILDALNVQEQITNTVGLSWKRLIPDGYYTLALSNNTLDNRLFKHVDNDRDKLLLREFKFNETETKLRFNFNKYYGPYSISAGATVQDARYFNSSFFRSTAATTDTNGPEQPPVIQDFDSRLGFQKYGGHFTISRDFLGERLSLNAGFRIDGNNFMTGRANPLKQFAPRFNALYNLSDKWVLSLSSGRYYKIPTYTILGYRNTQSNELLNQNTDYISSDHIVGGVSFLPNQTTKFSIEGFFKNYQNYPVSAEDSISLANLGGNFGFIGNENVASAGEGRAYGAEFLFQQKLSKNFYGILAYTLYWSEFTSFGEEYVPSAWDNRHLISFTGGYKLPRNWEVGMRWRFLGPRPYTPIDREASKQRFLDGGTVPDYDRLNEERLRSFHAGDLRITKTWNAKKYSFQGFLEIQNFYGANQPSIPSYALDRNAEDRIIEPRRLVNVDLNDSAPLPQIGFVLEF